MLGVPQMSHVAVLLESKASPVLPSPTEPWNHRAPPNQGRGVGPWQGTGAQSLNLRPACIFL